MIFELGDSGQSLELYIYESIRGNHIKNIRVLLPEAVIGETFNKYWLEN